MPPGRGGQQLAMTSERQPPQYRDLRRHGVDDVPEDAHPTNVQPIHAERRPVAGPLAITAALLVVILVVMLVVFFL
jgi:hypothetical protein